MKKKNVFLFRRAESDQPLITTALREQQKEARMEKYPRVIIRVHFPERIMLQGVFNVRESGKITHERNHNVCF